MYRFFNKYNRGKPKITKYGSGAVKITRAGLSSNPVERFNFVSGTVFANNALVKHGESFFIGGDTATHEFDFSTKIANSVVECPMKINHIANIALLSPTDSWSNFFDGDQGSIDKMKTQDTNPLVFSDTTNGRFAQFKVELDLTPICNAYFGGSNAALKAALKSITADVWAMGSGANASATAYGVQAQMWANDTVWNTSYFGSNTLSSIVKQTTGQNLTGASAQQRVNSNNKVYILIASQYASDGVIASSVSLDYLNIKIDLARTPDTVQPITVNLPKYFAMVIKGFSPSWKSNPTTDRRIFSLYKDGNNMVDVLWKGSDNKFDVYLKDNGAASYIVETSARTITSNKAFNFILVKVTGGYKLYVLENNGIVTSTTLTASSLSLANIVSMYLLQFYAAIQQADAFAESFHLLDLARLGKSAGLTDAEAEMILRGIDVPSENEMVVNGDFATNTGTGWTANGGTWNYNGGIATLTTATGELRQTFSNIIPNSKYQFIGTTVGGYIYIYYRDINSVTIGSLIAINSNQITTLTTPPNCAFIMVCMGNSTSTGIGNTFDNISLKYVKPSGAIAIPNPELFDINKVTLHANATRSNGVITLNASANYQKSYIDMPVLPNNQYKINGSSTTGTWISIQQFYNSIALTDVYENRADSVPIFTTKANTNKIRIWFDNRTILGNITFSNISLKLKM